MADEQSRNELSGNADEVVQARDISGGVHFYARVQQPGHPPRQLPPDARGFVNRAGDIAGLDVILAAKDQSGDRIAVCVVVGTAGVGKTSLAVHWAHRVADAFPDGQFYVNLHGYDPGPPVTAHEALARFLPALGVTRETVPADLESRAALFRTLMAGRRCLVVLDNAATVRQVRPLLPGVAGCLVLVTSRSRLSGLVARDGAYRISLGVLPSQAAVDLLKVVTSDYRSRDDERDLAELATLCARLPLALRIAAERAISRPQMPLRELIDELRDESALWEALTGEDGEETEAVRTGFAWSYRALPKGSCRLFRLLGFHPGGEFSSAAAAALAGLPVVRVRRLLDDLVGAHLLEQPQRDRYQFHDLLRLYAIDQARAEETVETTNTVVKNVLLWYLHSASALASTLGVAGHQHELPALDAAVEPMEFASLGSALEWFHVENGSLLAAVRMAEEREMDNVAWLLPAVLYGIYARYNYFDDWITTSSIALGAVRRLDNRAGEAEILESLGKAHSRYANRTKGIEFQSAALAIHRELGNDIGEATSTNALGLAYLAGHNLAEAMTLFERTNAIATQLADPYWIAISRNNIANVQLELEQFAEAAATLREVVAMCGRIGIAGTQGDALRGLSHAHRGMRRPDEALVAVSHALDIAREHENPAWEAHWLLELSRVHMDLDEPDEALVSCQRAASLQRQLGDRLREACAFDTTGAVYQAVNRHDEAVDFHRLAITVFREHEDPWRLALALEHLGNALSARETFGEAADHWQEALEIARTFDDPQARRLQTQLMMKLEG